MSFGICHFPTLARFLGPLLLAVCLSGCLWDRQVDARLDDTVVRPERAVLVMFFDGLDIAMVRQMAADGELPHIREHLLDRGVDVECAVTVIPSITFAANVSLTTGQFPGRHHITGNRWFDRNTLELEDYDGIFTYERVNDDFRAPTLFEHVPELYSVTILTPVRRGSTRHFANWISTGVTYFFAPMEDVDALTVHRFDQVAREARQVGRWPDILWTYFFGPDVIGHRLGKDSPRYRSLLLNADEQVGRLIDILRQAEMLDRTLLVLVSDHGHVVVDPAHHVDMRAILRDRFDLRAVYDRKIGGFYPDRLRRLGGARVALTDDGDRRAAIHLRVGEFWSDRPTLEQIERFHRDYGGPQVRDEPAAFWDLLLDSIRPAGRLAAVRDGEHRVLITDGAGRAEVRRRIEPGGGAIRPSAHAYAYRVLQPPDPLKMSEHAGSAGLDDGGFYSSRRWLEATCDGRFPDFVPQIVEYFGSPRSGEIMIFSTDGWDFSRANRGGHGGIGPEDMLIPLVFSGPDVLPGGRLRSGRIVDVVPTLLDYFGRLDALDASGPIDGISLLDALRRAVPAPAAQPETEMPAAEALRR